MDVEFLLRKNDQCGIYTEETGQKFNDLHISPEPTTPAKCVKKFSWRGEDCKTNLEGGGGGIQSIFLKPIWISQPSDNVIHYLKYS